MPVARIKRTRIRSDAKQSLLSADIRKLAINAGPGAKLPTITEMCAMFGTSKVTLDGALTSLESQNVVRRKTGNGGGIFVSPTLHRRNIGLVLGAAYFQNNDSSPYWSNLLSTIMSRSSVRAQERDEGLTVYLSSDEDAEGFSLTPSCMDDIEAGKIDAIIAVGITHRDYQWIESQVCLVVYAGNGFPQVGHDEEYGYHLAAEWLIQNGCRRLACWQPRRLHQPAGVGAIPNPENDLRSRTQFRRSCEELGVPYYPELMLNDRLTQWNVSDLVSHQQQGFRAAADLLSRPRDTWPDGLFISDDMLGFGALTGLLYHDKDLRNEIKVVCHSNVGSPILFGHDRWVALLENDPRAIVTQLYDALDRQMDGYVFPKDNFILLRPTLRFPI